MIKLGNVPPFTIQYSTGIDIMLMHDCFLQSGLCIGVLLLDVLTRK